jgi:hypothetical protein
MTSLPETVVHANRAAEEALQCPAVRIGQRISRKSTLELNGLRQSGQVKFYQILIK